MNGEKVRFSSIEDAEAKIEEAIKMGKASDDQPL